MGKKGLKPSIVDASLSTEEIKKKGQGTTCQGEGTQCEMQKRQS